MNDIPPAPDNLTPTQAMRWREAARALASAWATDINALDRAGRTVAHGRMCQALADMMALLAERGTSDGPPCPHHRA